MTQTLGRTVARPTSFTLALLAAMILAAAPARGQWSFKILNDNDPSAVAGFTQAVGINDAGIAVGNYLVQSPGYFDYGFQYAGGTYSNIAVNPNSCNNLCNTLPNGINDSGEIVGEYDDPNGYTHGFYRLNGNYSVFDVPNMYYTIATGINNKSTIVGFYQEYAGSDETDSLYGANVRGFVYTPGAGQPTSILLPGCAETELFGINNAGTVVGNCPGSSSTVKFYGVAYNPATNSQTTLFVQGSQFTHVYGINDAGQIVGTYYDGARYHCFLYSGGSYTIIPDPPSSTFTSCTGINNVGQVVGYFIDGQSQQHGFIASGPVLLDPVPTNTDPVGLLNGPAVGSTDWLQLAPSGAASHGLGGRIVDGIAADGVAEIVIRVPAKNAGDQFTLTLLNDGNVASTNAQFDGALGNPGDTTFTANQVTVSAISLTAADRSQSPYAFAVYRAPIDFVRPNSGSSYFTGTQHFLATTSGFSPPCGGAWPPCVASVNFGSLSAGSGTDDQLASRGVTIQVQDLSSGNTSSMPVEILRPPVVMIHGLWDNWKTWNSFSPLINGQYNVDPRFYIGRVNYDRVVLPPITGTDPPYPSTQVQEIHANALGFAYNAPFILGDAEDWIDGFKEANNPLAIPVAAVQADIIAHSMGGDIARTMVLQPTFLVDRTFGQGAIHKLITIDTPHLGSTLAAEFAGQEKGGCLENLLASKGKFGLNTVALGGLNLYPGAIADLAPGSFALSIIANQQPHPIPTAPIAGVYTNWAALDTSVTAIAIRDILCPNDLLAQDLTSTGWPQVFQSEPNDAIVSEDSQLNDLAPDPNGQFFGYVHSPGTEKLGFAGPSVLDSGALPNQVITLLNTPWTNGAYYYLLNP